MSTHYQGTEKERQALDVYIKLERAAESVGRRVNDHLLQVNLTTSQFGVLEALYHRGPLVVGQLGEKILKSSGNMTLVVDNLEKRGLVRRERRPDDRRCIEVHLTAAGTEQVKQLLPGHVAGVVEAFGILTAEEQTTLAALCRKLGLGQAEIGD